MLLQATMAVALLAMATNLWMAFYLFARGFPNTITMRMVVVLLALSGFFFGAYNNIFVQTPGTASIRAMLLVVVLGGWYSLTYQVMSERNRQRYRPAEWGTYALGITAIIFLAAPNGFTGEQGNALYVAHMSHGWAYRVYGLYQFLISFGILLNLLIGDRVGLTSRGKYYLVASIFPVISVIYGVIALGSPQGAPRIIQDFLAFAGVFVLSLAVARHQIWTERRATIQDFPVTTLSVLGIAALYAFFAKQWNVPMDRLSAVIGLVIITLGVYDLTREMLERSRIQHDSQLRKQLRQLEGEITGEEVLKTRLQGGLDLLCHTLYAPGGFVAIRQGEKFVVMASKSSVAVGSELSTEAVACEDVAHPKAEQLSSIAWIAPSFEGQTQVAVMGIEKSTARMEYSTGNLELLAEVADQMGTIISLSNVQSPPNHPGQRAETESLVNADELKSATGGLLESISTKPDEDVVKMVEEALRHLHDSITLGQGPLAEKMLIKAESQIERGKYLQEFITIAIESLKPAEKRPPEPLPRVWYNYAVLYDAYVEGVSNREIMARLYISEGTFNRTRRNAIRGLARMLVEKTK